MPSGIFKRSEEHKKNISLALMGKKFTKEHCKNLSAALTGKKQLRELVKKRIESTKLFFKNHPEELKKRGKKISDALPRGENHPMWKGDDVSYGGLHNWVYRKLGQPSHCMICTSKDEKFYEWANVSHEYKRHVEDWIRLCVSCHRNYDLGKLTISTVAIAK